MMFIRRFTDKKLSTYIRTSHGAYVMKEITVTEPAFVTRFSCSGSACRDHCCKGWKITLDKTTVKKYLASKDTTIRTIAQDHIILLKKNNSPLGRN